jgi:hypothetical protein
MPEAFRNCLIHIDNLSDEALQARMEALELLWRALLDEQARTPKSARYVALSTAIDFLWLVLDQAKDEAGIRESEKEIQRYRRILEPLTRSPQPSTDDSEPGGDYDRLLKRIEDREELIRLRRTTKEAAERELSRLSAGQIDSCLGAVGVPADDPLRRSLNRVGTEAPKTTELTSEPSLAQSFKDFAAEIFIKVTAKHPRGVPQAALKEFAGECDNRGYKPNSDFLPDRVCKSIKEYNNDHPSSEIENFSQLIAVLSPVSCKRGSVKKRQKNSRQRVSRKFRLWLAENKRYYLEQQEKRSQLNRPVGSSMA